MTIHDDIDNLLAADLHNELSDEERNALHTHLVECADCRKIHQETKTMNTILEEKFANEKPDVAFEQRILAHFRNRTPQKGGFTKLIVDLVSSRAIKFAGAAALFFVLVLLGRMIEVWQIGSEGSRNGLIVDHFASGSSLRDLIDGSYAERLKRERESFAQAEKAPQTAALAPAAPPTAVLDKDARTDVTRFGVRAPTDMETKSPASTVAGVAQHAAKPAQAQESTAERAIVTGSNVPTAEEVAPNAEQAPSPALANRKLIRNATVELETVSFDEAVQKITALANEEKGYVATTSSEKQENGKLKGEIVVKVLPENLDRFLQKIRGLGELKNQTLGTEDITKNYFDTEARLKNARVMEQRLIEMLKKKSDDVNDLLQVEKELGRVREEIEKMQGDLKFWDSQVQFATVTISLAEKDMEEAAKYLLKERAQLALYTAEVEKVYNDLKALASSKVQITNAQLDRDNTGRVSARVSLLIAPEESDGVIAKAKAMGRVENFQTQTERIAQGGKGMSENARTKRDKVELNITISRDEQEQALQQTSLRIRTGSVDEKAKQLRSLAEKQNGRVRNSTFSRDPNGREFANVMLRVPMKGYAALMQSLNSLGKVENVSVQRQEHPDAQLDEANAPADLSIQVYSQGNIVSQDMGLLATLRRTIAQSAAAIMWSLRMIGVAIAFLAPWVIALVAMIWITRRIARARNKT
jgi:Domain of unknown function (DUF4349)/Putative zinc-finger